MRIHSILIVSVILTSTLGAGPALFDIADQQMAFDAGGSSITGGPVTYSVTIDVEGENGGLITTSSFRRWWGVEITPLTGGETLNCTVTNFGHSDLILPVVSTSTDGISFTATARIPDAGSLADNVVASPQSAYDFQFVVPASVTHVRLWKYFPYTIADKDESEGTWEPAEIGERIRKSMKDWPEPARVMKLLF